MDENFLNDKKVPTQKQIINFFFDKEEADEILNSVEFGVDEPSHPDELGPPKEVKIAAGTEWEVHRIMWETQDGPKYIMYLKKVEPNNITPNFNPNMDFMGNSTEDFSLNMNPFYNFNIGVPDFDDYEDVEPLSFDEQLNLAIENEDFKEAARLRDWNKGLDELLEKVKPSFIKAIEDGDFDGIDRYYELIYDYRSELNES